MSGEHLRALADQVETLTGSDRELDGSIWWASLTPDEVEHFDRTGYVRQCIERDGSAGKALNQFYDSSNKACLANIAFAYPYTSSVDAAMSLMPTGLRLMLSEWDDEAHLRARGPWQAVLSKPGCDASFDAMRGYRCEHAMSPALAITVAALRARAARLTTPVSA